MKLLTFYVWVDFISDAECCFFEASPQCHRREPQSPVTLL